MVTPLPARQIDCLPYFSVVPEPPPVPLPPSV
jgi:hypothetical protein